eukprot:8953518-Ditylum_brightwellii.AAC.1
MPQHNFQQQDNVSPALAPRAVAETQARASLHAAVLTGKEIEVVIPTSPSTNSVISSHVQHHAENITRNLDQGMEEAKAAAK